jgi:hypothetical protein
LDILPVTGFIPIPLITITMRITVQTLLTIFAGVAIAQSLFTYDLLPFTQLTNSVLGPSVNYTTVCSTAAYPHVTETVTSTVALATCSDCTGDLPNGTVVTTGYTTIFTPGTIPVTSTITETCGGNCGNSGRGGFNGTASMNGWNGTACAGTTLRPYTSRGPTAGPTAPYSAAAMPKATIIAGALGGAVLAVGALLL